MRNSKAHIYRGRTNLLLVIFLILLVLVTGRFFYLQIIKGDDLRNIRENNINAFEYIYPKRGRILSTDGYVLAEDRKTFSLAIDLEQKPSEDSIKKLSQLFPSIVDFDKTKELVRKSLNSRKPEIVIEKLNQQQLSKFLVRVLSLGVFQLLKGMRENMITILLFFMFLGTWAI